MDSALPLVAEVLVVAMAVILAVDAAAAAAVAGLGRVTARTAIRVGGSHTALLLVGLVAMLQLIGRGAAAMAQAAAETARLEVVLWSGDSTAAAEGRTATALAEGAMVPDGGIAPAAREPVVQASVGTRLAVATSDLTVMRMTTTMRMTTRMTTRMRTMRMRRSATPGHGTASTQIAAMTTMTRTRMRRRAGGVTSPAAAVVAG